MKIICSSCLCQNTYFVETTTLINQILLDSTEQSKFKFKTKNILLDPLYSYSYDILIVGMDYNDFIFNSDSIFGIKNPLFNSNNEKNKYDYYYALSNYKYNDTLYQVKKITNADHDRIFAITYWEKYMDDSGHITKHLTAYENDSLLRREMEENWKIFYKEFGDCYVGYEIPIFNIDFSYCYFEWFYCCRQGNGQSFRGLYKKDNGKWIQIILKEESKY